MSNSIKILVVDDESVGRDLLQAILLPEGYKLLFGTNGEEALELIHNQKPDIILCDVMMPKLDGFSVVKKLRANQDTAHIPIFLITALDDKDSRIRGIDAGADDYISKPFNRLEILAKIKNHINLVQHRMGKNPLVGIGQNTQLLEDLIKVFDTSVKLASEDIKTDIFRPNLRPNLQNLCAAIKLGGIVYFLQVSNHLQDENAVLSNIIFQKYFEVEVLKGEKSPCKIISTVFEKMKENSLNTGIENLREASFTAGLIAVNKAAGFFTASGHKQVIFTDAFPSDLSNSSEKAINAFNLEPSTDILFRSYTKALIVSPGIHSINTREEVINQLNKHYPRSGEANLTTIFSPNFTQTRDFLVLELSF